MIVKIPTQALIVLVGAAGSGKSTLAHQLFAPESIVSSDKCRWRVSGSEENMECSSLAFELYYATLSARLAFGGYAVADATNLRISARNRLVDIAAEHNVPVVYLFMDLSLEWCLLQNTKRTRFVPEHIIRKHHKRYVQVRDDYLSAKVENVYLIPQGDVVEVEWVTASDTNSEEHHDSGLDFIGDVHGCYLPLLDLLTDLGYHLETLEHPEGRKLVFVGDIVDRGPRNADCLDLVMEAVEKGHYCVMGNHDNKIGRALKGNPVKLTEEQEITLKQLEFAGNYTKEEYRDFLLGLPYQLTFKCCDREVTVCHAGMPIHYLDRDDKQATSHCLYGERDVNAEGIVRTYNWASTWENQDRMLIHGHDTVFDYEVNIDGPIVNVDTGCVFGGPLTAYRLPEMEAVHIPGQPVEKLCP